MLSTVLFSLLALCVALLLAFSALDAPAKISPQGCRMSYMSPSYTLQTGFNASWTSARLADRYRLMLYREVGWDSDRELQGVPVLFIPGNAGSAHQVRSIASSATRQYYASPSYPDVYFSSRGLKPLDIFAVDFNEDLSAFHGPTLELQRQYASDAIAYILSHYPLGTRIVVTGHSMGGIVATSLLPSNGISAIVTMSTPHGAPPARFDARMDWIYADVLSRTAKDSTPILSICGGITDTMIPSEFCSLPPTASQADYRRTVFTSSLEGCWTGVGHREMVWCHQVRWRVARAILELGSARTNEGIAATFDHWFRDGLETNIEEDINTNIHDDNNEIFRSGTAEELVVKSLWKPQNFSLNIHETQLRTFVLYMTRGSLLSLSPPIPSSLKVSVNLCRKALGEDDSKIVSCNPLSPSSLSLIPSPDPAKPFPEPGEGSHEAGGIVAFRSLLPKNSLGEEIIISVDEGGEGWLVSALEPESQIVVASSALAPIFGSAYVDLDSQRLLTHIRFSEFLSDVLLVYRVEPKFEGSCQHPLFLPLLLHTSGPTEGHYYRLENNKPILLHGHSSGPFVPLPPHNSGSYTRGLNLTLFSSGECGVKEIQVSVDWWYSLSRWGPRYWNAVLAWSAGIVGVIFGTTLMAYDSGAPAPTPTQSLKLMMRFLPLGMVLSFLISLIPLPRAYWLGNSGEPLLAFVAPFVLFLSSGLVAFSWFFLLLCIAPYGWLLTKISRPESSKQNTSLRLRDYTTGLLVIAFLSLLVTLFVPWQVTFLACFLLHTHHCAGLLFLRVSHSSGQHAQRQHDERALQLLVLLTMTWALPVVAPVLAVWARTIATAGTSGILPTGTEYWARFGGWGDHNVLNVLPWMVFVYVAGTESGLDLGPGHVPKAGGDQTNMPELVIRRKQRIDSLPTLCYFVSALVAFMSAPRATWRLYEALNVPTAVLVGLRVVLPRYRVIVNGWHRQNGE